MCVGCTPPSSIYCSVEETKDEGDKSGDNREKFGRVVKQVPDQGVIPCTLHLRSHLSAGVAVNPHMVAHLQATLLEAQG